MSNDLLTRVADKLHADAQFGYGNPDMQLIRDLAARVRELEADNYNTGEREAVSIARIQQLMAERDRWVKSFEMAMDPIYRAKALEPVPPMIVPKSAAVTVLMAERDALRAENERLRGLLRDAVSKMRMVENHVCPPDEWDETVEAIDAALAAEEKP